MSTFKDITGIHGGARTCLFSASKILTRARFHKFEFVLRNLLFLNVSSRAVEILSTTNQLKRQSSKKTIFKIH